MQFISKEEKTKKVQLKINTFSNKLKSFYPYYLEYKKTKSFAELRRRLIESDRVMGKLYMDGEQDLFCGNISEYDGSIRLRKESVAAYGGVVRRVIKEGGTSLSICRRKSLNDASLPKLSKVERKNSKNSKKNSRKNSGSLLRRGSSLALDSHLLESYQNIDDDKMFAFSPKKMANKDNGDKKFNFASTRNIVKRINSKHSN